MDAKGMNKVDQLLRAIQVGLLPEVKKLVKDGADMDYILGMRGTALCAAIEAKNLQITQYLLKAGCDVNAPDFDGELPLLLAIRKESPGQICGRKPNLDIVKMLIDHPQCNLNSVDSLTKKSAIHFATEQNMVQVVLWLVASHNEAMCDVNQMDVNGNSPLHLAVLEGLSDIVEILVSHPKCLLKVYNKAGLTPLHICARNGDDTNTKRILHRLERSGGRSKNLQKQLELEESEESELDMNINAITFFEKETPLHIASRMGGKDVVKLLVDYGANVNVQDNVGITPLLACLVSTPHWQTKDNEIPRLLLKKGAWANVSTVSHKCRYLAKDEDVTPLILAAVNNNLELAKLLVQHGADVNKMDRNGRSPLFMAFWNAALPVARFLLQCPNVNVNSQTDDGDTCLHVLVKCRTVSSPDMTQEVVKLIMASGGQILGNKNSKTVLDKAFEYEDHVLFDAVMEALGDSIETMNILKADLDEEISKVQRWIHMACSEGLVDMFRVLLAHGADINACYFDEDARQFRSNLYISLYNSQYKMAEFLVRNGIDLSNDVYIFDQVEKCKNNREKKVDVEDGSESESDESSLNDSFSDEDDHDLFRGNIKFHKKLLGIVSDPHSLQLSCLIIIRKWFINNGIPFRRMSELKLPTKLVDRLRYRN